MIKTYNTIKQFLRYAGSSIRKHYKFFITIIILLLISIVVESQHEDFIEKKFCIPHAVAKVIHHLTQFLWLELIGGWIVWVFLEDSVKKYLDVPRDIDGKNYKEIAHNIKGSNGNVLIFDNDINPYFIGIHSPEELDKLNNNLSEKNKKAAAINLKEAMEFYLGQPVATPKSKFYYCIQNRMLLNSEARI